MSVMLGYLFCVVLALGSSLRLPPSLCYRLLDGGWDCRAPFGYPLAAGYILCSVSRLCC